MDLWVSDDALDLAGTDDTLSGVVGFVVVRLCASEVCFKFEISGRFGLLIYLIPVLAKGSLRSRNKMAVLYEDDLGYILDSEQFINREYACCRVDVENGWKFRNLDGVQVDQTDSMCPFDSRVSLKCHPDMYDIRVPFLMDSEFQKYKRNRLIAAPEISNIQPENGLEPVENKMTDRPGKKRKRRQNSDENVASLERNFLTLLSRYRDSSGKLEPSPYPVIDNNKSSRELSRSIEFQKLEIQSSVLFSNDTDTPVIRQHGSSYYVIPRNSRYFSSTFHDADFESISSNKFDCILMDPPWQNKSAKRLQTYDYLDERELKRIPISCIANKGALIAVWITNNERLSTFVETDLFKQWNVTKEAEWIWVKMTRNGEPIGKFSSPHKRPFEKIIFGRYESDSYEGIRIPDGKIFASVPSAVHSHKPCLKDVLQKFLPVEAKCLELFARSLVSGWASWGLEVIKLQHVSLFKVRNPESSLIDLRTSHFHP